ncbi:MAG: hypothetical protein AAF503_01430 [Pseudomonadota bacterium]
MFFFPAIARQTISLFQGAEIDDLMSKPGRQGPAKVDTPARVHPMDLEDLVEQDPCAVRQVLKEAGIDPVFADVCQTACDWPEPENTGRPGLSRDDRA